MIIDLDAFKDYKRVDKLWGYELWLTNTEHYCCKILGIKPGFKCSLHRHAIKSETFIPLLGEAVIRIHVPGTSDSESFDEEILLGQYSEDRSVRIDPGTWHQFWSADSGYSVLLEISTFHSDSDVERLDPSGPLV